MANSADSFDRQAYSLDAAGTDHGPSDSSALYVPTQLLGLSVQHYPAVGICVLVVDGELDLLTVPLLEQRLHEQLVAKRRI